MYSLMQPARANIRLQALLNHSLVTELG